MKSLNGSSLSPQSVAPKQSTVNVLNNPHSLASDNNDENDTNIVRIIIPISNEENNDNSNKPSLKLSAQSEHNVKENSKIEVKLSNPSREFSSEENLIEDESSFNPLQKKTKIFIKNKSQQLKQLKMLRRITNRKKRRKILMQYPLMSRFSSCNSKIELVRIFQNLSVKWKRLIKMYMERSFLMHLHIRQIKDFSELMAQRQNIYDSLDEPEILILKVNFGNNLVKNFCKGLTNFVVMFYEDLLEQGFINQSRLVKIRKKSTRS